MEYCLGDPDGSATKLREAIARATARDSGWDVKSSQVLVTNGGKQAVYQAFQTVVDDGDDVLLPAPYWTTYPEVIALAGGRAVGRAPQRAAKAASAGPAGSMCRAKSNWATRDRRC